MAIAAPRLVLLDSVTQVGPAHAGLLVVTGSHGGASVVRYARAVRAWLYVFNDAGGTHEAGCGDVLDALELLHPDIDAARLRDLFDQLDRRATVGAPDPQDLNLFHL